VRLLARNAEALFWLARYLERASSLARVIEMQSSFAGHDQETSWRWLLTLHTDEERFNKRFEASTSTIIPFYLTDMSNPGSIRSSVHWARENARSLRPFIPLEMWVQLNAFHTLVEAFGEADIQPSQLPRTCAAIRAGCLAQIGTAECTLYRDEGYRFFKLGLMIERADQTSRLLDVKFALGSTKNRPSISSDDFVFWSTILRAAGAYQVFNRMEPKGVDPERVARFLVLNPSHPRSIGFCIREIDEGLHILRSSFHLAAASKGLEACDMLTGGLQVAAEDTAFVEHLHELNDWVQRSLYELTAKISTAFFQTKPPEEAAAAAEPTSKAASTAAKVSAGTAAEQALPSSTAAASSAAPATQKQTQHQS
jgi:uncharacterized alpha-E superfamily protein